ncbi:hypothetical protein AAFF_G00274420 [Aldrovandia affinis]|uniref:Uncharacterized protein n=1 Tax=Aldrovandia affinis TaxID=143900 RepID=A0AAD7SRR6_9TELE|nr:hypothetical protein AAFF_G00274420 [Aldrovandia affinis]
MSVCRRRNHFTVPEITVAKTNATLRAKALRRWVRAPDEVPREERPVGGARGPRCTACAPLNSTPRSPRGSLRNLGGRELDVSAHSAQLLARLRDKAAQLMQTCCSNPVYPNLPLASSPCDPSGSALYL